MTVVAMLDQVFYGGTVADPAIDVWPTAGQLLLDELDAARGRVAIIVAAAPAEADDLLKRLHADLGLEVVRLGPALADRPQPPSSAEVESACRGANLITDLDVLMWPEMHVSPMQLLSALARRQPTIAVWPGDISGPSATYSAPGRPDHHHIALRDVIVLRPRSTRFPDEVPFTIERIRP